MGAVQPNTGTGQIQPEPPETFGIVWIPFRAAWLPNAGEDGTISVTTPLAITAGRVTAQVDLSTAKDGLREGHIKRADATTMLAALGTTPARVLNGDDTVVAWIKPTQDPGAEALFGIGFCDAVAQATMGGGGAGLRATGGELVTTAFNTTLDALGTGAAQAIGAGFFVSLEIADIHVLSLSVGYDPTNTDPTGHAFFRSTTIGVAPTLNVVLFHGVSVNSAGTSDLIADVWVGLRSGERSALP